MIQKLQKLRNGINLQLGNFVSAGNVKIPLTIILDNNNVEADNVVQVESKEEAEKIINELTETNNFVDKVKDYEQPLYLTVIAHLPGSI
ncbi:hypothetical protein ACQ7CX_03650 [Chryseobacterium arthrosphaerae]|uniref:hypothetical protein n=1 Tax=Chryseobacterium arthrosphaerae TaxID=651561 RepID=UPI001BAF0C72|nr:hypothetical protein [Chryseobacterium arthrosphaerae]QUY57403.1 hypothetical protein I2F65_08755 [Chryseobacterium arthrosphaerae]